MAIANDSILVTPGSGATVATHLVSAKEHQVVMIAGENGQIVGSENTYVAYFPQQAVGASKVFCDLFNATGSGLTVRVHSVRVFPALDVAVTGIVGVQLSLTRTTAVGTGGTAGTTEGTSLTAPSIAKLNPASPNVSASVTARSAPAGGATAGAVVSTKSIFTEETNAGAALAAAIGAPLWGLNMRELVIPENSGLRVVQGTVASVGSVAIEIVFSLV